MPFISYAQNFEDVMLRRALRSVERGFYIDVGAADPVEMSVTKTFYDAGWHGVNIEPSRYFFERLREQRPEDVTLEVALTESEGNRLFYEIAHTGLSTLNADLASNHRDIGFRATPRTVRTTTLAAVCSAHAHGDIHFLKIDVEGAEGTVLAGADFAKFRPWIILLEATEPLSMVESADWEPMLLDAGYVFVWFDGLNRFYVAAEREAELRPHFRLPPNSFDDFRQHDFDAEIVAKEQEARVGLEEKRATTAERQVKELTGAQKILEGEIRLLRKIGDDSRAMTARNAKLEDTQTHLTHQVAALERDLGDAQQSRRTVERLAFDLRWDDGPRALKLVLPLARGARRVLNRGRTPVAAPGVVGKQKTSKPKDPEPARAVVSAKPKPAPIIPAAVGTAPLRRAVHQFHPGVAYGDAVTNSMLLTRRILRNLGYRSDIYVQYPDAQLPDDMLLLDDLPETDDYVLIVLHSLGYGQVEKLATLPAPKVMMYHNITPAHLLSRVPDLAHHAELGREQLDFWRDRCVTALAVSEFNALELRRHAFPSVGVCPLLFDVDVLRARATPGRGREPDQPFTVLFVGRIVESKAQCDLVDSFAAFHASFGKPCRLVLVGRSEGGSDSYVADLYRRIGDLGLRDAVVITGQVSDEALIGWFDRADLYVSLSHHEGFGVPLIEAMAHDVPVIAYAAGAIPYTMDGAGIGAGIGAGDGVGIGAGDGAGTGAGDDGAGILIHDRDPERVAEAMLAVATDADRRTALIAAQRRNLERFALPRHIPTLLDALARAGAERPVTRSTRESIVRHLTIGVAGHVNGTYSLASVNRSLAFALNDATPGQVRIMPVEQVPTDDLSGVPAADMASVRALARDAAPPSAPLVVISQHYPVHVPAGPADLAIAMFFWEESLIPAPTVLQLNCAFDAVFAPSRAVAKALIDSGVSVPVRTVGYAPRLEAFAALGAARNDRTRTTAPFTFLHLSSAFPRKGIDILLAAFVTAFAGRTDDVRLLIKSFPNPHNDVSDQIARLRAAHPNLPDIRLIDADIDEAELLALYEEADAVVLPSRGEGFNIPAAEAMAAGVPLIVTGAGGHADFITDRDAILLPWRLAPSGSHLATSGSLWLEPDADALAKAMLDVLADDGAAQARAGRARSAVAQRLDRGAWARRVTNAAVDLLLAPSIAPLRIGWVSPWDVRCGVAEYTRHLLTGIGADTERADEMIVFADDRTTARTETCGDLPVRVLPTWRLGGADSMPALARAINREDPDVLVIEHQPGLLHWDALVQLLADPRVSRRIVVVALHATLDLIDQPDMRRTAFAALQGIARVIVHTVADVNFLHEHGVSDNVVMIPQGAAPALASPKQPASAPRALNPATDANTETPVIGCYGFLLPGKGIGQLIAALPTIRAVWPRARLRLINALHDAPESATERDACTALAAKLGVADGIEFHTGFLPGEQSVDLMRGCDLIVLPYRPSRESSSAALRSCLSSLTPVLVSAVAIFDEAGDAVARLAADTPEAIAAGVLDLLADQPRRAALSDAAMHWTDDRSWARIARRTNGMLAGLVAARHRGLEIIDDVRAAPAETATMPTAATNGPAAAPGSSEPWLEPYSQSATREDIIACFRLLLGRSPHREEWRGHSMHVGGQIDGVVASYLNSLEFTRRGLQGGDTPAEIVVTDLGAFKIHSDLSDDAVGKFVRDDIYEHEVAAVFRSILRPGMGVLDIGANIGYFALLSASIVGASGQVFAIEPNPHNARQLEASRRLNDFGQITVVPVAAAGQAGLLTLHTSHSTGTTSDPSFHLSALLASTVVPCVALDSIIPPNRRIDLIKIDVDGGEYMAMRGCEAIIARDRPMIISEFAPELIRGVSDVEGEDYLRWMIAQGYDIALIEADGSLTPMGQDREQIMKAYRQRDTDHVDILGTPRANKASGAS